MTIKDAHAAVDFIIKNAKPYAQAKAQRIYLEEFRKSKKALLMADCQESTAVAREQYAYGHKDYLQVLSGLREAVEQEEALRWQMVAAQARIEVLRSEEASARAEVRATT
jgi:hypothetical protein